MKLSIKYQLLFLNELILSRCNYLKCQSNVVISFKMWCENKSKKKKPREKYCKHALVIYHDVFICVIDLESLQQIIEASIFLNASELVVRPRKQMDFRYTNKWAKVCIWVHEHQIERL